MSRLYNIFSGTNNRSGKGISKGQAAKDKKMGCSYFFYLLRTRLGKISATNLIFTLCNFTLILFLMGITGMFDPETSAPSTPLYSQIYGMETGEQFRFNHTPRNSRHQRFCFDRLPNIRNFDVYGAFAFRNFWHFYLGYVL